MTTLLIVVVSTLEPQPVSDNHSNDFLPPWAVAVIVIGLASVAFVIVFGVSMVRKYFNDFMRKSI